MPLADPKPRRGSAKRQRARLRARAKDADYRTFVLAQPCLVCRGKAEGHHERTLGIKGDACMVPLCRWHHRGSPVARHGEGPHGTRSLRLFEEMHGVDIKAEIRRLRSEYDHAS